MLPNSLAKHFPKLVPDGARKTSEPTHQYNCIAWAAKRDTNRWWQPYVEEEWDYRPDGVPDDGSLESFIILFESLGYERCENRDVEIWYEKVAIYGTPDEFTHVAGQLASGAWTSKLGPEEDIEHNSLEALEGTFGWEYGFVKQVLKRRCGWYEVLRRMAWKWIGFYLFVKSKCGLGPHGVR